MNTEIRKGQSQETKASGGKTWKEQGQSWEEEAEAAKSSINKTREFGLKIEICEEGEMPERQGKEEDAKCYV